MGIAMPKPVLIGNTYYLRVGVPRDIAKAAKGRKLSLPIGDTFCSVTVGDAVKASLRTKDVAEAKERYTKASAALHEFWQSVRSGPKPLTHKQIHALAGETYKAFVAAFDENPGAPDFWLKNLIQHTKADTGRLTPIHELMIPTKDNRARMIATDLEKLCGPLADAMLQKYHLITDASSRLKLLQQISFAIKDASLINHAKARGDYSNSGQTDRFPTFEAPAPDVPKQVAQASKRGLTFDDVIDRKVKEESMGHNAMPMRRKTEGKYRKAASEFAEHRGSDVIATITSREADAWKWSMYEDGKLKNTTIRQRLQNIGTIIEWARKQSLGELFPNGNPLDVVELPKRDGVRSEDRTYTLAEARKILLTARKQTKAELRWLPWLCAYSGARIEEVAPLQPNNFFIYEGEHFYRLTTKGGRSLKNHHSERCVPIHPDLISEGLLEFVGKHQAQPDRRLFPKRAGQNVAEWVRDEVEITRKDAAPSHSWRHLFEDKARAAGMTDSARHLITGRATSSSSDGYGKSEVMLPGLMREMRKMTSYLNE